MAFNADFFTITKRRNSTLQPVGTGSYQLSVTLNDGASSLLNPSIRVVIPADGILQCNYVHITKFSRYYYIDDWTYNGDGTWTAACSCDVLASWRTQIKSSYGYIDRAYVESYTDTGLIDTLYPAKTNFVVKKTQFTSSLTAAPSGGCYLISVLSSVSPSVGPCSFYYMNAYNFGVMMQNMLTASNPDWSQIDGINDDILKSIVNPMQYITKVMWIPTLHEVYPGDDIKLGGWNTGAKGAKTTDIMLGWGSSPSVSVPQPATGYKLYPPYSKYTFISPVFGTFELDGTIMAKNPYIDWRINVNTFSGAATLIVTTPITVSGTTTNYELFRATKQLGVEIPLAQISTNYSGMMRGATSAVSSAINAVTNPAGAVAGIFSGVLDAVTASLSPSVQSSGSLTGGFDIDVSNMYIESIHYQTALASPLVFGYPIKAYEPLTGYSGYVKLVYSDFNASCTSTEKDQIISFLESGVFLE